MDQTQAQQAIDGTQKALELAEKYGLSTFLLLVFVAAFFFAVYKATVFLVGWFEKMHDAMTVTNSILATIESNHLTHIEATGKDTVSMLGVQNQILGIHGVKLDVNNHKLDQVIAQTTRTAANVQEQTDQTVQTADKVAEVAQTLIDSSATVAQVASDVASAVLPNYPPPQ